MRYYPLGVQQAHPIQMWIRVPKIKKASNNKVVPISLQRAFFSDMKAAPTISAYRGRSVAVLLETGFLAAVGGLTQWMARTELF